MKTLVDVSDILLGIIETIGIIAITARLWVDMKNEYLRYKFEKKCSKGRRSRRQPLEAYLRMILNVGIKVAVAIALIHGDISLIVWSYNKMLSFNISMISALKIMGLIMLDLAGVVLLIGMTVQSVNEGYELNRLGNQDVEEVLKYRLRLRRGFKRLW